MNRKRKSDVIQLNLKRQTRRNQKPDALSDPEANLSALINNINGSIWSVDTNYRLINGNSAFHENVRAWRKKPFYQGDTLLANNLPREVLNEWRGYYDRALSGELFSVPIQSLLFSNSKLTEYQFSPIRTDNGSITGVAVFGQNVTEKKRLEDQLITEHRLLSTLLDNIPNCIAMILKKNTREIVASNAAAREIGAVPGQTCFKTCANRSIPCAFCLAPDTWDTNHIHRLEVEHDGIWYEGIWVPLSDELYVHYIYNITDRKLDELKLQNSEIRYRELIQGIKSGVAVYEAWKDGRDFIFKEFNPAAEHIDTIQKKDVIGRKVTSVFPNIRKFGLLDVFQKVWQTGKPMHHPLTLYKDKRVSGWRENYVYKLPSGDIVSIYEDITEQKKSQRAIQHLKDFYGLILENVKEGIWVTDKNECLIYFNPGMERIAGVKAEDVLGLNVTRDFAPEATRDFLPFYRKAKRQRKSQHYESKIVTPTGRFTVQEGWLVPRLDNGKYNGMICTINDITDRKYAESEKQKHQEKYETLFNTMIDGYALHEIILDKKGKPVDYRFLDINNAFEKLTGLLREDVIGKTVLEVLPQTESYWIETYGHVVQTGKPISIEEYSKEFDKYFEVNAFCPQKGQFAVVFMDITKRRKAEEILKWELSLSKIRADISRELISQHYDINKISDIILDYARHITNSQHGFVSSIDKLSLENIGHTLTKMFGKQCRIKDQRISFPIGPDGKYPSLWGHALNTKESFFTNQPRKHPSAKGLPKGHIALKNYLAVPVLAGDRVVGLISLANAERDFSNRDIEAIERLAEIFAVALLRYEYEMERSFIEKQLQQSQKLEAIGTLAGGIAHDFNNILSAIIGYSEISLVDIPQKSELSENLQEILKAGVRAKELVNQILTFSRQKDQELQPVQIKFIAKEALKLLRASIPATIEIKQNIRSNAAVLANPTQIHQVFMNLCTNAAHAMQENGGILDIALTDENLEINVTDHYPDLVPGDYMKLSISDTGCGISPYNISKIFDPFFTTKEREEGTGLGLSVVHGIIKSYKGEIMVHSVVDKGTTFEIYIPIIKKDSAQMTDTHEALPLGTERILFIDDELQITMITKKMLELFGYEVTAISNSMHALELFKKNPADFDLVITDMTMPILTGDKLAIELLKMRPDIPVILCTGYNKSMTEKRAADIGIKTVLIKPLTKNKLAHEIRKVLDEAMNIPK